MSDDSIKCEDCKSEMPIEVLRSPAGFYIGRFCPQCGPYSRDSGYHNTRIQAQIMLELGDWARKPNP